MKDILSLVRPELLKLKPYSSARDEFQGDADIFLDANENPFGFSYKGIPALNRYPDPLQRELKLALSSRSGIAPEAIFTGNGSDEIIDLMIRVFCIPGSDSIIITPPTYGMYEVQARIHNINVIKVPLTAGFLPDKEGIAGAGPAAKILFLCSPNNPTGNLIPEETIISLCRDFSGMVLVDEAYIDFSGTAGSTKLLSRFNNLMVLRTFSKARGMAGARLGIGYSNEVVTALLNSIKLPYNVNSLTADAALRSLESDAATDRQVAIIIEEREALSKKLSAMPAIQNVFPSDANFLLLRVGEPGALYKFLAGKGIVVRDRSALEQCEGCIRITVGTPPQNRVLLEAITEYFSSEVPVNRSLPTPLLLASKHRRTRETDIFVKFTPAGRGVADIQTGIGFLDHMLELLAFHSGSDIIIRGNGDLHVDAHHLTEDVAITLGTAVAEAISGRAIERYGFTLPMDESLATVAVDISGRAGLEWDVSMSNPMLGDLPAEMVSHFFRSFASAARCSIHVTVKGENDHHKVEAVFKAFGRAMRMALRTTADGVVPSSKGVI